MNNLTTRILVVDDNLHNVDMLVRRLQRTGYTVTTAYGGREAIDTIDKNDYDLVVLDIMMPEVALKCLSTFERHAVFPNYR